jgi:ABC-type Fe3+-hydroxamate transport system substrate-binding protein
MTRFRVRRHLPALALAGCLFATASAATAAVTATDDTGVTVTLAAPAQRIVSLAPHATELLFAAGGGDRVMPDRSISSASSRSSPTSLSPGRTRRPTRSCGCARAASLCS